MVITNKFRLVKLKVRVPTARFDSTGKLETVSISKAVVEFQPEIFESSPEADEFRSLKDHPEDYIILQIW